MALLAQLTPLRSYAAGELPEFTFSLTNSGGQVERLLLYMVEYRLKAALVAQNMGQGPSFEAQPFAPAHWSEAGSLDVFQLQPGQQWTQVLRWDDAWSFAWVARHSQPPVLSSGYGLKGFPAGRFRFSTALLDQMAIYTGQAGVFDRSLQTRRLPQEVPGYQLWGPLSCPELEAQVEVSFS